MVLKNTSIKTNNFQAQTRFLLALWDLGGAKGEVKKGDISKRIVSKNKKVADYQSIFAELQQKGAIAISNKGYSLVSPIGLEVLGEGLQGSDFKFEGSIIGTWTANALLKWINQMSSLPATKVKSAIASYEEFKQVVLKVYDQLNRDYNLSDLVPIYRLRREIGDRVSREDFNEWLLKMQEKDVVQLQGGGLPDSDPEKVEDSITTEVNGLRCYAKRLNS